MITKLRYLQGNKRLFYNIDIFQLSTHALNVSEQRTDIALTGIYNTSHTYITYSLLILSFMFVCVFWFRITKQIRRSVRLYGV